MSRAARRAAHLLPAGERFRLRAGAVLAFVLLLATLLALPVLLDVAAWIPPALLVVAALASLPRAWWSRRKARPATGPWFRMTLLVYGVASVVAAAPIYALAITAVLRPALQPQVVLSNGTRTFTFQGMMHVGTDAFYRSVVFDIEKALADGAAIYYEGVLPDERADAWLADYLGMGEDLALAYRQLATTCGLVFQADYFVLLEADRKFRPSQHVAADVSSQQLRREFERLLSSDMAFLEAMQDRETARSAPAVGHAPLTAFVAWLQAGSEKQQAIAGTVCRGTMTLLLKRRAAQPQPRDPFDALVIDYRNTQLVARLLADKRDRIFLTYGSAHLPGVYALLKQDDPNWRVESVKWLRSIAPPERLRGKLDLEP